MGNNGNPTTASFRDYIEGHGGFRTNSPHAGDLVMWNGHVEIVVSANNEYWTMSGTANSSQPVPRTEGGNWLNTDYTAQGNWPWGDGTFLGFWTPYNN
jgi:hypothetical protein